MPLAFGGFARDTRQTLNGGGDASQRGDVVQLPGRADSYQIAATVGRDWGSTRATITTQLPYSPTVLELTEIERVTFETPFIGAVRTGRSIGEGGLPGNAVTGFFSEAAQLSVEAYDHNGGVLSASSRGWRGLSFLELGLRPSDFGSGEVEYAFDRAGAYTATFETIFFLPDGEQFALVLSGVVNGKNTVMIAFEGTTPKLSEFMSDIASYGGLLPSNADFQPAYATFQPLIAAIRSYVADPKSDVDQIIVTGHSLGGALAQLLAAESFGAIPIMGFAFANPGPAGALSPDRFVTIEHTADRIANITGEIEGARIIIERPDLSTLRPFQAHSSETYRQTAELLTQHAFNTASALYNTLLGANLRAGTYFSGTEHIYLGTNEADANIRLTLLQSLVLAGEGNDRITIDSSFNNWGKTSLDGGDDIDTLVLTYPAFLPFGAYVVQPTAILWQADAGGTTNILSTRSIEIVILPDGRRYENGVLVTPEQGNGQAVFNLQGAAGGFTTAVTGNGDQQVTGSATGDTVFLGSGIKTVNAGSGDDIVVTMTDAVPGVAASFLDGGEGADTLVGGWGDTIFFVDNPGDTVTEGANGGYDGVYSSIDFELPDQVEDLTLSMGSSALRAVGNLMANNLIGNELSNLLIGAGGDDSLLGDIGDDVMLGGAGDDVLDGGPGQDTAAYSDATAGVVADLSIFGSQTTGGGGNDTLTDIENLAGSGFNDTLSGSAAPNLIQGGAGNDTIRGAGGDDTLNGGAGADQLDGGEGLDTATFASETAAVFAHLGWGYAAGSAFLGSGAADIGQDTLVSIEALVGGAGNDILIGGDTAATLDGGAGGDWAEGGAGGDTISGGDGNDAVLGGGGNDTLSGGAGDDGVIGGAGNDALSGGDGIDWIYGEAGDDVASGGAGVDIMLGGDGADTLNGEDGNDALIGEAGADTLSGGLGDDWIEGGADNDALTGGDGADTLLGQDGDDTASGGVGNDGLSGGAGADTLNGDDGDDYITGEDGVDTLNGGAGNDGLFGGSGANVYNGGDGDDGLIGGGDGETMNGGAGADWLQGWGGADQLTGGTGGDSFVYTTNQDSLTTAMDRILDFNRAEGDVIRLVDVDANWLADGDQAFTIVGAFSNQAGQMTAAYTAGTNITLLSFDMNGDSVADMAIEVVGNVTSADNFIL